MHIGRSTRWKHNFVHSGALVLKFWLQIDKDEQERRFNDRMKNRKNGGRSQTRTGETGKSGMLTCLL